jgi:hypothetical protein
MTPDLTLPTIRRDPIEEQIPALTGRIVRQRPQHRTDV